MPRLPALVSVPVLAASVAVPAAAVWTRMGNFDALMDWHPAVDESAAETLQAYDTAVKAVTGDCQSGLANLTTLLEKP